MRDLSWELESTADSASTVTESGQHAQRLAVRIEREVQRQTGGGIRDLAVDVQADRIRLTGRCQTYYHKQLAQQVAMIIPGRRQLLNDIEVT